MSYVYMKVLESAPDRYDRGMSLLTLGRLTRVHKDMANRIQPGEQVLDIGCGTGTLAVMLARRGAEVTGIDSSPAMLSQAIGRIRAEGLDGQVVLRELGAVDIDLTFSDASMDAITSSLVFSEFSDDEIAYTLAECWRILKPGGHMLVADEVLPSSALGRVGTFLLRLPFALAALLLTQTTTHRVAGLRARIEEAGFIVTEDLTYLAGTMRLYEAAKAKE